MSIHVTVLLEILELLFQNGEGLKLLEEHRLFPEIGDCLVQIIQVHFLISKLSPEVLVPRVWLRSFQ